MKAMPHPYPREDPRVFGDPGGRSELNSQKGELMNKWWRISRYTILLAAGMSFLLSTYLWFSGSKEQGIFVGLWVPSILAFGAFVFSGRRVR
jgi:hypothetical protein